MKIIYLFFKKSPVIFYVAVITGAISGLALMGMIYCINEGISHGVEVYDIRNGNQQTIEPKWYLDEEDVATLNDGNEPGTLNFGYLIPTFLGLWLLYGFTSVTASYFVTRMSQDVILDLRVDLSRKIMQASFTRMERSKNQLLAILTDDIMSVVQAVTRFPNILTSLTMVLGALIYMAFISWQLIFVFLLLFTLAYGFFQKPLNNFKHKMRKSRDTQKDLLGHFNALINGLKELLLNFRLRHNFIENTLLPSAKAQKEYNLWSNIWVSVFSRSAEMVLLIGFGSILIIISNTEFVSFATLKDFLMVALFTISPLSNISSFLPFLGKIDVALEQIESTGLMLDEAQIDRTAEAPDFDKESETYLALKDVSYTYYHEGEEKYFQLGPINLEINKGEMIYLLGGNGSGKSTLAKIICGLYLPESGKIEMAGVEQKKGNLDAYRENFNSIFTDFFLFEDLGHVNSESLKQDVEKYLKLLELDKKVKIENNKLSTTSLSTGQRQRLALLLSYLDDKPFYIFDEWAATQDPYYKEVYYRTLLPDLKAKGKTLLIITHDEKYFDGADRFIMLQDGQMLNPNDHEDLLAIYNQGIS